MGGLDCLLRALKENLEPIDFIPQFGLHESSIKYVFCWALEKAGIRSFRTEVSLPIYPQAPHLRGLKGKVKSIVDLAVEVEDFLVGFEFKVNSLSRVGEDDAIAYMNNLSCTFFTCLKSRWPIISPTSEVGRSEGFWLSEFEMFPKMRSESFGLLAYEPNTGTLSILKKPSSIKRSLQRLCDLEFNEEDGLKYKVWRNLRREGYKVICEPKPKRIGFDETTLMSAPPRRKYIYFYTRRFPRIKRIDLIAIKEGITVGVEVKSSLRSLSEIAEQLRRYLSIYDLDILYLAVPVRFVERAKMLLSTYTGSETSRIKILGVI